MAIYHDGNIPSAAKLTTWGKAEERMTFEGYPHWPDRRIRVTTATGQFLISRDEIAALAALFPREAAK